jgi:hypothetical protein
MSVSDWKEWNLQRWNERLLNHFFRAADERASPVSVLLVTAEELARATGDLSANPEEVRAAFVDAVRSGVRRSESLLEDASDYQAWPGPPHWSTPPRFVAHLLFTCIAASESSDELGDEDRFVGRLRELTRNQLPEHSLQMLPRLWEHLSAWLRKNEGLYRLLVLPNPGGLTRIGYTVKLSFPDRRDQRQLSDLLDRAGLAGHEPPVGRVLSLVSAERRNFRSPFIAAFEEFRRVFESMNKHSVPRLAEHRFWAAVREAALRGRGQSGTDAVTVRFSLLGEEDEDRLILFAVSDELADNTAVSFSELPIQYGFWKYALVPKNSTALDAEQLDKVVRSTLEGELCLSAISGLVDQGLLPFISAPHGLLELVVGNEQLEEASVALVRETLAADLFRLIGHRSSRASIYQGWVQIAHPKLRTLSLEEVEGTTLARTWLLQQSLTPTVCHFVGGVRADDGWLGVAEVLPSIVAPGASGVVLECSSGASSLTKVGQETWTLPCKDIVGQCAIVVTLDGQEERRRPILFHPAPASETFKAAADPDAWIVEGIRGTSTLADQSILADVSSGHDFAPHCERSAFLGRDVGVFTSHADSAAWRITRFANKLLATRANIRGEDAIPRQQVENSNARRRWRKMLLDSIADASDPQFDEARRLIRGRAFNHDLERISVEQTVPELASIRLATPISLVDRLVRIIAGRAAKRAGIDWNEWTKFVERVLHVNGLMLHHVTRAWMEAGLIDVGSYARWRHRRVFARVPHLIAFQVGECLGATLSGLVLQSTFDEVRRSANRLGVLVEERFSISPLVPPTLAFRARSREALEAIAASCHLQLRWLNVAGLEISGADRHRGTSEPPQHYERTTRWLRWSLMSGDYPTITVEHHMRPDRPDYWTASQEGRRVWSYEFNVIRIWAARLLGEPAVATTGETSLEAHHAFVPLRAARVLSVLGAGLSGPVDGKYRYIVGTPQLRDFTLGVISRAFDPLRLVAEAAEQANG